MNYAAMLQLKLHKVVDAVPWHGGVLLGHPAAVSVLLLSDQMLG